MRSVLLIGAGRFGRRIARRLNEMGVEVLAVDTDEERLKEALPYTTRVLVGDATSPSLMKTLGVSNFDECIVSVGEDFLASLEITSLLKELGAAHVIARAARDTQEKFLLRNGADEVIYPEKQMANWVALRAGSDHIFDYLELEDGYGIYEIHVPDSWIGRSIGELNIRYLYGINILAVKDGGNMNIAVGSEYRFEEGQTVLALGSSEDLYRCMNTLKGKRR